MSNANFIKKAASDLLDHRQVLSAEIERETCNFTYETDGPRPMVSLDLDKAEALTASLGQVAEFLLLMTKGGAA